ncbi:mitochondrial assembly of ribosomal large subunit protein 1 [Paramisgurnus dabryanus]|uniref:mitochondrial assembly of ribosomal large subunit protein 1 n=1 Tax=Paramisgurnus dabryanus TaxID=90735 RepID=UPI0031F3FCE9
MIAARCLASNARHRMIKAAHLSCCQKVSVINDASKPRTPRVTSLKYTTTIQNCTTTNIATVRHEPAEDPETRERRSSVEKFDISLVVSVLRQENATDICVIKVSQELKYTDYIITVTGASPRHLTAMAEFLLKVFKFLRRDCNAHVRLEGRDCDDWKCIDFGSLVIHLMLQETRETYELEKLWTLRSYDEQLMRIPPEKLPTDFIYEDTNQTSV